MRGIWLLVLFMLCTCAGCAFMHVGETRKLEPGTEVCFSTGTEEGMMLHVSVDLKNIDFDYPEFRTQDTDTLDGWLVYGATSIVTNSP